MCKLCTALQTLAGAGIMGGTGLAIPGGLTSALGALQASPLAAAAQTTLAGIGSGFPALSTALQGAPSFLTGMVPTNLQSLIPSGITGMNPNNLFSSIAGQGANLLSQGPAGFTSLLTQAQTSAFSAANFKGLVDQFGNGDMFKDFGFNMKNSLSLVTNGMSSDFQFGTEKFSAFTSDLKSRMGTMFDVGNLSSLGDPRSFVQNLLNQGHDKLGTILGDQGINLSGLADADSKSVMAALEKVTGSDLKNIMKNSGFNPADAAGIKSLADIMDVKKVFSAEAAAVAGGSWAALSKKFSNSDLGPQFSDFGDLGSFLGDIRTTQTNLLDSLPNLGGNQVSALFATALEKMPEGTGAFGSPTINDILGSASGQNYVAGAGTMSSLQASIGNSQLGQNLLAAIQAAQNIDPSIDPGGVQAAATIQQAVTAINNSGNAQLQADLARGNSEFSAFHTNLLREKVNLQKIGFTPTDVPKGSTDEVLAFSASLGTVHKDDFDSGNEGFIRSMITSNFAGQAITASIDEGYNHAKMQERGIPVNTQLDPVEYYKKKKAGLG